MRSLVIRTNNFNRCNFPPILSISLIFFTSMKVIKPTIHAFIDFVSDSYDFNLVSKKSVPISFYDCFIFNLPKNVPLEFDNDNSFSSLSSDINP